MNSRTGLRTAAVAALIAVALSLVASVPAAAGTTDRCQDKVAARLSESEASVAMSLVRKVCRKLHKVDAELTSSLRSDGALPVAADVSIGVGTGKIPWAVTAECLAVGVVTGTNSVQWVVAGSAQAEGPAVGTSITCTISGGASGSWSLALPGPVAAVAGTTSGTLSPTSMCATGFALFIDGSTASSTC